MYDHITIILVVIATIINSIVFGYVASNSKNNKTNQAYLTFLTFIVLYIIFDCIVIQAFSLIELKDIIIKVQAMFWMPLSILFLNFIYLLLKKERNEIFYFLVASTSTALFITLFSDKVLLGYKNFNIGTGGVTGPWFLPITFIGILPAAIYALYLIEREGKIVSFSKQHKNSADEALLKLHMKILFFGSMLCLIIAVATNIVFDEILGLTGKPHLASLSLSIQSIFILPALIKYNFLNKPMEKIGDELYANSTDAVLITNLSGIILNLNKSARKLFNIKGKIINKNFNHFIEHDETAPQEKDNYESKTKNGHDISITQSNIETGNQLIGKILVIRNISLRIKAEEKLLIATDKLIEAQNVAQIGNFEFNIENNTLIWSNKLFMIYGLSKKTFHPTNENFLDNILHPEHRKKVINKIKEVLGKKGKKLDYFHKIITPKGVEKWMHTIAQIIYNADNNPIQINGTAQDITELYSTRIKLEESENRLQRAQEIAKLGNWEENHKTGEIYWSPLLRKMLDVNLKTTIKQEMFWAILHKDDLGWMQKAWKNAENKKKSYSGTFRIKQKNKVKHLMEHAEFITNSEGDLIKTIGTVMDITELHKHQEALRQLSSHIQEVQEEERGRIAREIHDELGQRITSISMDLSYLNKKITQTPPAEIKDRITTIISQADNTIQIIRKISQELRPSVLDDLGLISAIDWLKEQCKKRTDIHFTMEMPTQEINIKGEQATAVFRITQEAITNIMRHSKAKNVKIKMEINNSEISLTIKDDGKGIGKKVNIINNKTFGVFGMKERATNLGGSFKIKNNFKKGTLVELKLPYK